MAGKKRVAKKRQIREKGKECNKGRRERMNIKGDKLFFYKKRDSFVFVSLASVKLYQFQQNAEYFEENIRVYLSVYFLYNNWNFHGDTRQNFQWNIKKRYSDTFTYIRSRSFYTIIESRTHSFISRCVIKF